MGMAWGLSTSLCVCVCVCVCVLRLEQSPRSSLGRVWSSLYRKASASVLFVTLRLTSSQICQDPKPGLKGKVFS